jgi:hypothetical protein
MHTIHPPPKHFDVRLVHVPPPGDSSLALIEPLKQFGRVSHNPSVNGRVIDRDAALGHHLFQVPEAQIVGQIPADTQKDHRAVEIAAFEHQKPPELIGGIDRTKLLMGLRHVWTPAKAQEEFSGLMQRVVRV